MTFRARLTVLTTVAVAVVLVGASLVVYTTYRRDLLRQADGELAASLTVNPVHRIVTAAGSSVPFTAAAPRIVVAPGSSTILEVRTRPAKSVSSGFAQASGPYDYDTVEVNGVPERRLTIYGLNSAVTITRSLSDVDRSLAHLRFLLVLTCAGGIGIAFLLGALLSGRAIAPLRRLTETTERIAETGELSARTGLHGRDEISRLSAQLDALLATLEQSLHSQRQLVADASHELRTPLATLRANVGLLERSELVDDIESELHAMTALVTELVELAHGEELGVEPTEFRLDEVVGSAVERAARRARDVSFRTELEPTTILGVPDRVERAVDNLLDNARKWSPAGETIDVSVRGGVVEVRDRGPGIAAEDAPLVFNRFYRSLAARGTPGAGLGLAIVKQVADAHDGSVTVAEAPGGGAVLRLALLPFR